MAIKGKSRGKSKPRSVARAPRPAPVVVKPPFFLRRKVQVTLAFIAGVGAMVAFIWATDGLRQERLNRDVAAQDATARQAVSQWKTTVEGALTGVQFSPQTRAAGLFTSLSTLVAGGQPPKGAAATAATAEKAFKAAADALQGLSTDVIRGKGLSEFEAASLIDSRDSMASAFRAGQEVAGLVQIATGTDQTTAKAIAARSKELLTSAQTTFSAAYESYSGITVSMGLSPPLSPQLPSGSSGS
jgi:hypothetical protein